MARTSIKLKTLLLIITVFGAARALAESTCIEDIRAADRTVEAQGANAVSAMAANLAVMKCEMELRKIETKMFQNLAGNCQESLGGANGTVVDASIAICKMNAARYIVSLQLTDLEK